MATWVYSGLRYVDYVACDCSSNSIGPRVLEYEECLIEAGLNFEDIFTDSLETTQAKLRALREKRMHNLGRTCEQSRSHRPSGFREQRERSKSAMEEPICLDWNRML